MRSHSRFKRESDPLLILQKLSTNMVIYTMETTIPSSVAKERFQVRPMNQFTAEVLHPWAQQAAITREDGRAGTRVEPRFPAGPGTPGRPMLTLERSSGVPQSCVPRRPRTLKRGPAAGALELKIGCWLLPELQKRPHLPNMLSASPIVGTAPFISAAAATLPRPA